MKKSLLTFLTALFVTFSSHAQVDTLLQMKQYIDSIHATLKYQHGTIKLKNGVADLKVPAGFKYLDAEQSEYVLTKLWGNPTSNSSLGMIFPETMGPLSDNSWGFNIMYDEVGYVEDDDAEDIDYDELLTEMQKETDEESAERTKEGYEAIKLVGWAAKPYYDKDKHILHWAKELQFGEDNATLNYNVRVLGRKGVLILNAIGSMQEFKEVNQNIAKVTDIVQFNEGSKYSDFDPDVDEVAAYTIGGLVAGKVLAKVGFFALIAKFGKVIVLAIVGAASFIWKWISGRGHENDQNAQEETTA